MTVSLNSTRKHLALKIVHKLQVWMELRNFDSDRCTALVREGDYLAGLLFDSPCGKLGEVLNDALVKLDEKAVNNALAALEDELTGGVC